MPAVRLVEWREPHQAVDAPLALQIAVSEWTTNLDGCALDAGLFALGEIENLRLVPMAFGPAQVHPKQHLSPVLGFGPTGPGVDRQQCGAPIVWPAEPELEFEV